MAQAFCVSQFGRVGDPQVELLVIARCLLGVAGQQWAHVVQLIAETSPAEQVHWLKKMKYLVQKKSIWKGNKGWTTHWDQEETESNFPVFSLLFHHIRGGRVLSLAAYSLFSSSSVLKFNCSDWHSKSLNSQGWIETSKTHRRLRKSLARGALPGDHHEFLLHSRSGTIIFCILLKENLNLSKGVTCQRSVYQ